MREVIKAAGKLAGLAMGVYGVLVMFNIAPVPSDRTLAAILIMIFGHLMVFVRDD